MLMFRALLPVVLVIAVLLILYFFLRSMSSGKEKRDFSRPSFDKIRKEIDGGELHRDPVSGTYVSEGDAHVETIDGRKLYFVSRDNAERYRHGERAEDER